MDTSEANRLDHKNSLGINARFITWIQGSPKRFPLLYLAFLALAETTTTLVDPRLGMVLHGICLVSLIIHASLISQSRERLFLLGLSFSPLIRLLSLTMPLHIFPIIYWYLVVGIPIFLASIVLIRITDLNSMKIGTKIRKPLLQILIGITGLVFGYFEYIILRPKPLIADFRIDLILVPAIILLIFTGFLEELVFRGIFQYLSIRIFGRWGLLYVALVFTVLHIGYQSLLDMIFVFFVAIFFGVVAHKTGSILGVTLSHGLTNIALFLIFPFFTNIPTIVPEIQEFPNIIKPRVVTTPIVPLFAPGQEQPTITLEPSLLIPLTDTPASYVESSTPPPSLTWTPPYENTSTPQTTSTPPLQRCSPPIGWVIYTVHSGDTLSSISRASGASVGELKDANCLGSSNTIWVGQQIFVPVTIYPTSTPIFTLTITPWNCPQPAGWVIYIVQSDDTLASISSNFGVSISEIQDANCMGSSTYIWTGQELYVPHIISATPTPSPTSTPSPTQEHTPTIVTLLTDTPTQTNTSTPTATSQPTDTPTNTSTSAPTSTSTPTNTSTPTEEPPPTNTPGG